MKSTGTMIRRGIFFVLGALVAMLAPIVAAEPSVLVQITRIQKGTLPKIVTAYGNVQSSASGARAIMSPLSATVDKVYVRLGEEVAKNGPLLRLSPNPQAHASYLQAVSALHAAEQLVVHTRQLRSEYLATAQQLTDAEKSLSDARAALRASQAQGASGQRLLRAPFHAIVTALSARPGALVSEGGALLELAPPDSLVLRLGVVPEQVVAVKLDDPATVKPVGGSADAAGKVVLRGAAVDPSTGLVPVEISLPPGEFFPGQTAAASITAGQVRGCIVPHEAILVDDNGHPYIVQEHELVAKIVPVRVLGADGGKDAISGNINPNDPVVLAGNHQLQDGMRVRLPAATEKRGK